MPRSVLCIWFSVVFNESCPLAAWISCLISHSCSLLYHVPAIVLYLVVCLFPLFRLPLHPVLDCARNVLHLIPILDLVWALHRILRDPSGQRAGAQDQTSPLIPACFLFPPKHNGPLADPSTSLHMFSMDFYWQNITLVFCKWLCPLSSCLNCLWSFVRDERYGTREAIELLAVCLVLNL